MRTTFAEMCLLTDDHCANDISYICNGKGWGRSKLAERTREKREREMEHCFERVVACVINLTNGQVI
jgi:hypothetical protein